MIVKRLIFVALCSVWWQSAQGADEYGPAAALAMDQQYRGDCCLPKELYCYPKARGVPFADCQNIIPMTATLWTPGQLCADFQRRMAQVPPRERKRGIIVVLKTERCATKAARLCTITTAALEKRSSPLVGAFLVYGVQLKPRDKDEPPGSLPIETGPDVWKNQAAGEYLFKQGPGATLVIINPETVTKVVTINAAALHLVEWDFVKSGGQTPRLQSFLSQALAGMRKTPDTGKSGQPTAG